MAVALCLVVLAVVVVLVFKLIVFLIYGGVMAPSIAFSVLVGLGVWSSASLGWGVITAIAVFALTLFLGRYQKIFVAMTTMTACFSSYFIVLLILSLFGLFSNFDRIGNWTQALACVIVAAFSIKQNLDNPGAGLLEGNEVVCRVIASAMYGFTACFILSIIFIGNSSIIADVIEAIVWIVGAIVAYFIDCVLTKQVTE